MARPVPGGGCSRPCRPCRRGAAARDSSTPRQTGRRHRSPTAGAAPGSPHPPDVVAALGALEDFAESDPGRATPRRWRHGRKAQAGWRRSRSFPPTGHRVAPPPLAREAPPPPTLLSPRGPTAQGDQEPRPLPSSDETAVGLPWPPEPQQLRTRPRVGQGPGQTHQRTHRPAHTKATPPPTAEQAPA